MYDVFRGLWIDFNYLQAEAIKMSRLGRQAAKGIHRDVAQWYDRGDYYAITSVKQAVLVASQFSWRTNKSIGTVSNMDFSNDIVRNADLNQNLIKTTAEVKAHEDFRLLESFTSFAELRVATSFRSATSMERENAQVSISFRVRH